MRSLFIKIALFCCFISLSSCDSSTAEKNLTPVMHDMVILNSQSNRSIASLVDKMTDAQVKTLNECQAKVAAKHCGDDCNTAEGAQLYGKSMSTDILIEMNQTCTIMGIAIPFVSLDTFSKQK